MMKQMMMVGMMALATSAMASELDPVVALPGALIVRENAQGQQEVFKAGDVAVKSDADALAAIAKFATKDNRVSNLAQSQSAGELDRVSSDESWCFWWSGSSYRTYSYHSYSSYSSYRYVNYYYPSYNYSYGGYSYSYYYPRSSYYYYYY